MLHHLTRLFRRPALRGTGLLALSGLAALSAPSPARAETLPHLSAACFTYTPGQVTHDRQGVSLRNMQAELTGTDHRVTVLSSTVTDHRKTLDEAALVRLNAAAAYATLTAYHRGMTEACASQPLPEVDEIRNSLPELTWKRITISRPGRIATARTAHMHLLTSAPTIRLVFDATGIQSPGVLLLPPAVSGDVVFVPSPRPPYHVTINRIHTTLNGSDVDGEGHVLAAEGKENMQGDVHLSISHIGDLINRLDKAVPLKVKLALTLARLMGEHEPNQRTGWHITLKNATIRVNDIEIPASF